MTRQAVILAGGLGTRLRPVTETIPKPLMPVGDRFFLHYMLKMLVTNGVEDILLLVGHLHERVMEAVGDGTAYGCRIDYSVERELLGTGGAIKNAEAKVRDEFFVLNGDTYLPVDYRAVEAAWEARRNECDCLLVVYDNSEPVAPGNVRVGDDGVVQEYSKHAVPTSGGAGYVDAGVQLFKRRILDLMPPGEVVSLEETVFTKLVSERRLGAYTTSTRYYDIGTPERLVAFERYIRDSGLDERENSALHERRDA
ncbi:MAG: nucleotidyltransferase family protein [Verrucomicrobia bacterium]|nr:nucleotidyltransferase family protein [Verrucomicrobiota bacterium]